jgi:carbon-monoxide dehydrogenase medium subunit
VATSAVLREDVPLLAHVASLIGDPQVRHRGTIGGAVAHADPAGDVTTVLRTLDATIVVHGRDGRREIGVDELAVSFLETSLRPGELIAEVRIPVPPRKHGWAYTKFRRRAQDWATVAVAAIIERRDGEISRAAVGLVNMGPIPLRAAGVEAALAGADAGSIPRAAELAAEGTSPVSDLSADADFRRHLARVLTRRTVQEAFDRAAG